MKIWNCSKSFLFHKCIQLSPNCNSHSRFFLQASVISYWFWLFGCQIILVGNNFTNSVTKAPLNNSSPSKALPDKDPHPINLSDKIPTNNCTHILLRSNWFHNWCWLPLHTKRVSHVMYFSHNHETFNDINIYFRKNYWLQYWLL